MLDEPDRGTIIYPDNEKHELGDGIKSVAFRNYETVVKIGSDAHPDRTPVSAEIVVSDGDDDLCFIGEINKINHQVTISREYEYHCYPGKKNIKDYGYISP